MSCLQERPGESCIMLLRLLLPFLPWGLIPGESPGIQGCGGKAFQAIVFYIL